MEQLEISGFSVLHNNINVFSTIDVIFAGYYYFRETFLFNMDLGFPSPEN